MSFVEDVDFETVAGRAVAGGLAEFANFVDATVGGSVNFNDIHRVAGADLGAGVANAAGFGDRLVRGAAVQGHGQDAGHCRFPYAPVSAENVAMGSPGLLQRVLQRAGNVLLADYLGELLGTVLTCQDLIAHVVKGRLYVKGSSGEDAALAILPGKAGKAAELGLELGARARLSVYEAPGAQDGLGGSLELRKSLRKLRLRDRLWGGEWACFSGLKEGSGATQN